MRLEEGSKLHPVVIWPAAAFWRDPCDDLVRIGDVAGFAVDAVRWIQADALAIWLTAVALHFVDVGGTEILEVAAVFRHETLVADICVVDDEVRGLVLFVLGAR